MAVRSSFTRTSINGGVDGLKKRTKPGGVKVGILKGMGAHSQADHGQTTAEIFFWNEFGTRNADGTVRIPERAAMRQTMKANAGKYRTIEKSQLRAMLLGNTTVKRAEAALGLQGQSDLKNAIREFKNPGNAQATIDKKGADNPLEDSGEMRNSVHWESAMRPRYA